MNDIEKIMAQLDKDQPRWAIDWATERELREYVMFTERHGSKILLARLETQVAQRLMHRILNAALAASVVRLP